MEAAITILALLFVAFIALGVYVTVKVVGAAKRGVDRTITQARRTVEDTTLRAKSFGQPGVVGELAQLRLALRTSMRATQDALHAGVAEDASLSESVALFRRLSAHGLELDDELKRLEREPDRSTVAALLPQLKERTQRITHSAESLRWAARDRARQFADDDLDALNAQIDVEAGALRHWTVEEPSRAPGAGASATPGHGPGTSTAPGHGPGTDWPEPAASAGSSSTADEAWSGQAGEEAPQAITAPDPRKRTSYPWEKSARPETTN
ncbi:hypothetical protein CIB93_01975 [Streptomyces sp. WZ.A104]|uniref:hypothetical protein n=1 Tax=Streptomyces sp. WZ.A104 TaxID=2023771 RepID=UPI000BBC6197|nr:hypothetical protein [Streptomyces sp. WZ.A104]PCG87821.1 hypothetical protein CIB93_01975 [Streptomyces sp. WZ.A104]